MTKCLISILCLGTGLQAEEKPGEDPDRRVMTYLQNLTDADIGRTLEGVRVDGENTVLAGNTLLHRIRLPSKRAHVYVMREGPPGTALPTARAWVEPKGKALPIPDIPEGEPREAAYSSGEVYTNADIHPGDGLVELSCPTESWIKSLQEPAAAAQWGIESMATIEDPDGVTNVRDEGGKVITTVRAGERFLAVKPSEKSSHWEVYLPSGIVGLIHASRMSLLPDEPLMRINFDRFKAGWKAAGARRDAEAVKDGMKPEPDDYYPTLLRASDGDMSALSRFFARKFSDAPAERYVRDAWSLIHLVGDARFAEMLNQGRPDDIDLGAMLSHEWTTAPISDGKKYIRRHFPLTFTQLFGK